MRTADPPTQAMPIAAVSLMPQGMITRQPLDAWVDVLARRIDEIDINEGRPDDVAGALGTLANNVALVQTHAGRPGAAYLSCALQLQWLRALALTTGSTHAAAVMVQPWVNIGRLHGLSGRPYDALARYEALRPAVTGDSIWLDDVRLEPDCWVYTSDPRTEAQRFAYNVGILDGGRVLLQNRQSDQMWNYIDSWEIPTPDPLDDCIEDFRIVSLTLCGRYEEAAERAWRLSRTAREWPRIVYVFRFLEARLAASATDAKALDGARRLVVSLSRVPIDDRPNLSALIICERIAQMMAAIGDGAASLLAVRGYRGAQALGDEVLMVGYLSALAKLEYVMEDGVSASDQLGHARARTRYRRLQTSGEGSDRRFEELDRLEAKLADAIARASKAASRSHPALAGP